MRISKLFFSFLISFMFVGTICAQKNRSNEKAQAHIMKVMGEYKNPLAYFPFSRDLFLPTEEEMMKTELNNSYPEGSDVMGPFIFMRPGEKVDREPFLDAYGKPMFRNFLSNRRPPSLRGGASYFRGRQKRLQNAYPSRGKFLLFNKGFLEAAK